MTTQERMNKVYTRHRAMEMALEWAKHSGETNITTIVTVAKVILKFAEGKSK